MNVFYKPSLQRIRLNRLFYERYIVIKKCLQMIARGGKVVMKAKAMGKSPQHTEVRKMATEAKAAPSLTPPVKPPAPAVGGVPPTPGTQAKTAKEPKAPKMPRDSNFKKVYPDTSKITLLTEGGKNPKREGSKAHGRFAVYANGMTVAEAIKGGVLYADLSWDVGHGFIKVDK
jgi:hypothetical protein